MFDSNAERDGLEDPRSSWSYDLHQLYGDFHEWDITAVSVALSVRLLLLCAITICHLRWERLCWRSFVVSSEWPGQCQYEVDRVRCPPPRVKQTASPDTVANPEGASHSHPTDCQCVHCRWRFGEDVDPAVAHCLDAPSHPGFGSRPFRETMSSSMLKEEADRTVRADSCDES